MVFVHTMKRVANHILFIAILNVINLSVCMGIATYGDIPLEGYEQAAQGLPMGRIDCNSGQYGAGSLVNIKGHTVVVTAAHVFDNAQSAVFVYDDQAIQIVHWVQHPRYTPQESSHDIAVGFLKSVPQSEPFTIADLPPHNLPVIYAVAGFGRRGVLDPYQRGRYCENNALVALAGTLYAEKIYNEDGSIFLQNTSPLPPLCMLK